MKSKIIKTAIIVSTVLLALFVDRLISLGRESSTMNVTLGLTSNNQLHACQSTSNCFSGDTDAQKNPIPQITALLKEMGMELATQDEFYLHALPKSSIFAFVDDVEFYYIPAERKLLFRSASRVGKSDLGVNKKRIEEIKKRLSL